MMTSLVSIRLQDELFKEMKQNASILHVSQTDYIKSAIKRMNNEISQKEREKKLKEVSLRVRKESLRINTEFNEIENDPKS